jgi:hypothetical protein
LPVQKEVEKMFATILRKFRSKICGLKVDEGMEESILSREALVLLVAVVVLNVVDAVMTYCAVCVYGIACELNPLYNPANPFPKLAGAMLYVCCWLLTRFVCRKFPSRLSSLVDRLNDYSLYILTGIYVAVIASNVAGLVAFFLS